MAWLQMLGTILGLGFYYYALLSLCSAASFSVHHARCYEGDNLRNALSKREYDDEMKERFCSHFGCSDIPNPQENIRYC